MSKFAPPRRGRPPIEEPLGLGDEDEDYDYDEDDDYDEGFDDDEEIDMGRETMMRPARTQMPMRTPTEIPYGKPAVTFQIRKKISKNKGLQKIDEVEDAEPPTKDYIEDEWVPVYGGGTYAIYKDRYIVEKIKMPGDPIYQEDIEAEKKRQKQWGFDFDDQSGGMFGLMMTFMQKSEHEVAAVREENRRLQEEARRAEIESIRAEIRVMKDKDDSITSFMKQMDMYERLADRLSPRGPDMLDKVLNSPTFQRAANTMIDKMGEIDFSDPNLFKPKAQQIQGQTAPDGTTQQPITKEQYTAHIQRYTASRQVNISPAIIERAVEIALIDESDDPQENVVEAVTILDRLLDSRSALYHLKENVLEGDYGAEDAANYIIESRPNYADYLMENNYDDVIGFLRQFDDIPEIKPMINYAHSDDVKKAVNDIIQIVRRKLVDEAKPVSSAVSSMPGLEDGNVAE